MSTIRRTTSNELLAGRKELAIEHGNEEYRLRLTSKGKLILTK
ncbi:MAG: hemin uptake protein HemP [Gammaproteobacteria bacterium]|nr:hemin uptake protein HemP [Gammaproteobacteria bacterium]